MSTEQMRFAKRICKKEQILLFLSTKQAGFVVSCPLIIACFAFAVKRRKGEVQGFWTNSSKNFVPEQFKNAKNC